ncbi:MAG: chromate transporter [Oscillospiraceae bacterium]|nr:chromate transporter [Oscillospiraceae bacterium]
MILWELFLGFLEVGCFSFGGAYAAIPLIQDVVLRYGWLDEETLLYFIGVCESTPGPIMINLATYVGSSQAGILGSLLATFAVVLPAFLIILGVVAIMDKFMRNPYVKAIMSGLKPGVIGVILATGVTLILGNVAVEGKVDVQALILTVLLGILNFGSRIVRKKKIAPIPLIGISALLGILVCGIL